MFIDASAICAVLLHEPDAGVHVEKIAAASRRLTSPLALYEAVMAVARQKSGDLAAARRDVRRFVELSNLQIVPIGQAEHEVALDAFDRYGKGRHPAQLNMGDCFSYACARTHGAALLFKGEDFSLTDITPA